MPVVRIPTGTQPDTTRSKPSSTRHVEKKIDLLQKKMTNQRNAIQKDVEKLLTLVQNTSSKKYKIKFKRANERRMKETSVSDHDVVRNKLWKKPSKRCGPPKKDVLSNSPMSNVLTRRQNRVSNQYAYLQETRRTNDGHLINVDALPAFDMVDYAIRRLKSGKFESSLHIHHDSQENVSDSTSTMSKQIYAFLPSTPTSSDGSSPKDRDQTRTQLKKIQRNQTHRLGRSLLAHESGYSFNRSIKNDRYRIK